MIDLIEYATELAERFPDMKDHEIILSCEEFAGYEFGEVGERIVLAAYNFGTTSAKRTAEFFGATF